MDLDRLIDTSADDDLELAEYSATSSQDDLVFTEGIENEALETTADGHFDDAIKLYLQEVRKSKLLSADDERELASRVAKGEKAARSKMIEANLRLVIKIAKRYVHRGLPFLDLIAEGNVALVWAVDHFDLSKECRFSTYATWWIRQSIERALRNQSRTVRLPVYVIDFMIKMQAAMRKLRKTMDREPSSREVASEMGVEVARVHRFMEMMGKTHSIEKPFGDDERYSLITTLEDTSIVPPSDFIEHLTNYELVMECFATLPENERKILTLRFGLDDCEPQTLESIGNSLGLTRERIRQVEARILGKLRKMVEAGENSERSLDERVGRNPAKALGREGVEVIRGVLPRAGVPRERTWATQGESACGP